MSQSNKQHLIESLLSLKEAVKETGQLNASSFDEVVALWHETVDEFKDAVYYRIRTVSPVEMRGAQSIQLPKDNIPEFHITRTDFEEKWGAQSIQFVIDCIPEFHRILQTHYKRKDTLALLDVGAGSGAGSNIFTLLHSDRFVYSKLRVDAIDGIDTRAGWVKIMYPKVQYKVVDVYELPDKQWDLVFCSHVIEHVPHPEDFVKKLVQISKGFVFVYSPYNEIDRSPGHINTITESFYEGFNVEKINILKSMGWHADKPDDLCILAVIDCRKAG